MSITSERRIRNILSECLNGEVSNSAIKEFNLVLDKFVYLLESAIFDEFQNHNDLRTFHGLPKIRRLSGGIVRKAGENLYLNMSTKAYKSNSGFVGGETGQANSDTVLQEAIEVA